MGKAKSETRTRTKIPIELAACVRFIRDATGEMICLGCSKRFYFLAGDGYERSKEVQPAFCPMCGRQRAEDPPRSSVDG